MNEIEAQIYENQSKTCEIETQTYETRIDTETRKLK